MIRPKQIWSAVIGGLLVLGLTGIVFAQTGAIQPAMLSVEPVEPGNTVIVTEVRAPSPSWVVIHRDAQGVLGPVIGRTPVPPGTTPNVVVTLDEEVMAGDQLWVALYADGGETGTLEIDDGTDAQMILASGFAAQPVTVGQAGPLQPQQTQPQDQQQPAQDQAQSSQAQPEPDQPAAQAEETEHLGVAAALQAAQQEEVQEPVSQAAAEQAPAQQDQQTEPQEADQQPQQQETDQQTQQPAQPNAAEAQGQALQAQIEQAQVSPTTPTPQAEQQTQQQALGQTQAPSDDQPQQAQPQNQAQQQNQRQTSPATMPATGAGAANPLFWLAGGLAVVGLYCGEMIMRRLRGRSSR